MIISFHLIMYFLFTIISFNPNKAGHFEGSFFWGDGGWRGSQFDSLSYLKKNSSNIDITLYNC